MKMNYFEEWVAFESDDELDDKLHREPSEEYLFFRAVASGDVEAVRLNCQQQRFAESRDLGILSKNSLTNRKYHFVITTAMITRLCHQHGMEFEQAYRLSDFYIQKLDDITVESEVLDLHERMVLDFTRKMKTYVSNDTNSRHINNCKNYIYSHIKERITIEDMAEEYGISPSYLSKLFKKETGKSLSSYIREKKIDVAKNLLSHSEYSMVEIANRLAFASQSHFIQSFKEVTGMTPKKYRDEHHSVTWDLNQNKENKK